MLRSMLPTKSSHKRKQKDPIQGARRFHLVKLHRHNKPRYTMPAKVLSRKKAEALMAKRRRLEARIRSEKPLFRGWMHAVTFPLAIAISIILICLAPAGIMKVAYSIYAATAILLFGNSAALHLGDGYWPKRVYRTLCKIDYSNIFLIIAGTCTPFLFAMSNHTLGWVYFGVIWFTAIVGTICHLIWDQGLDWLFTIVYCVLGLAPVTILYWFWNSPNIGPGATLLVVAGGVCYIGGAVCFALRKPNPWPRYFGYHEIFHLGTILGYTCHVIALFMVVLSMR